MEANVISLRDFSISYNSLNNDFSVVRENLIDDIEELTKRGYKIIIIEGNEGSGKTNLLLQYSKKYNQNTFTYFINPSCSSTYKQDYLMEDIGKQLYFYVKSEIPEDNLIIDEGNFTNLLFELLKLNGRKKHPIFFVLDGLDQIEKTDLELLKTTLQALPWNTNNFYFILSGDSKKILNSFNNINQNSTKTLWVTRFTFEECKQFFNINSDNEKRYLRGIYDTWKGHPEDLSQIKAVIDSGVSLEEFANNDSINEKNDLLEILWEKSNLSKSTFDDEIIQTLSILTFNDNVQSIQKISDILNSEFKLIESRLKKLSFLYINNDNVYFSFKSFKSFLSKKLKKYERNASSILINYYTKRNDFDSITNLPSLYDRVKKWSDIIDILSIENFKVVINNSRSFSEIKNQITYGYRASIHLKKSPVDLFTFSLYRSTVIGLQKSDTKEQQIKALVSLGKQDDAFSIISSTSLKEDRLKMLINYVKECKRQRLNIDDLLVEEIKNSLEEVDREYLRENVIEIVIGLAYFLPEFSVKIIEKVSGLKADDNSLEWLLGYVATIVNSNKIDEENEDISVSKNSANSPSNAFLEKFAKSIGFGIADVAEENVINYINEIDSLTDKVYLIRNWIKKNQTASNIYEIIEFAISILLQSSSNQKPTTTILLDILSPLPYIIDDAKVHLLIDKIDELSPIINSPTSDKIKVDALIIESLINFNLEKANERTILLESYINNLTDYSIKVEALAVLWALVFKAEIDGNTNLDDFILDKKYAQDSLINSIKELLESVADHHGELKSVLQIIADKDFDLAISIAEMLNTEERRCLAIEDCFETYTEKNLIKFWDEKTLYQQIKKVTINEIYSNIVYTIFSSAKDQQDDTKNNLKKIETLVPLINKVDDVPLKCALITDAISLLKLEPTEYTNIRPNYNRFIKTLEVHLQTIWNKIDIPWKKTVEGYKICSKLAKYNKVLAEEYYSQAGQISDEYLVDNEFHAKIFLESIRLMIRFYGAIVANDKEYKFDKIESLINQLPSRFEKAQLWSELAVRTKLVNAVELAENIVSKKVIPLVNYFYDKNDKNDYFNILAICASAIHQTQPETLKLYLDNVPTHRKEWIISIVCYTLITKQHELDPYHSTVGHSKFNYQDATEYISLLNNIDSDVELYQHIKRLCYIGKKYSNNFVRIQKVNIHHSLTKLIKNKLPNSTRGIVHDGFSIACEACIEHFNVNTTTQSIINNFDELALRTSKIPNTTDRAYVYGILATECTVVKKKKEFIALAFNEADKILSLKERVATTFRLLEITKEFSREILNERINLINEEIYKLDSSEMFPSFRRLIDITYGVDKTVAQRVISSLDSDPARKKMVIPSNNHFENLELEKTVSNDYTQFSRIKNRKQMSEIAFDLLGELNSNKRLSKDINLCDSIIRSASKIPFLFSLNLFTFYTQNAIKNEGTSKNLLIPFFEAAYSNSRLTFDLICNISDKNNQLTFNQYSHKNSFLAQPGTREAAMKYIGSIIKSSASKEIYIVDPYFSINDITFIKNISEWSYDSKLYVLTSVEAKEEFSNYSFTQAWNNISSEKTPNALFVKASNQFKETPFHDRWILLLDKKIGIRLGTSIKSIGIKKVSDISLMNEDDVLERYENVVLPLMIHRVREYEEHLVKYESFDF
ncbi:ATP-binding protein [Fibrisoma montanum]|uniref:ATP-binding protein n=1 Tax=Fibrisoma montanum TaxID=2305895 RepID=A0A418M421_9BACT|nr:ATP-binding protein [Fibrisoma montanum]RIV20565.1 ATP-binding protein [Fibrisoma montanum]